MNIPIKELKKLSKNYGYDHIICFATKGKMQYVATYGRTIQECDQAAQFGDKMKDVLGWPESLHAAPSRVRALQKRIKELEIIDMGKSPLERVIPAIIYNQLICKAFGIPIEDLEKYDFDKIIEKLQED